ncbi:MAG: hypothetical protein C4337_03565 [Armatimonadota bacterium]
MMHPFELLELLLRGLVIIIIIDVVFSWIRLAGGRVPRYNPVVRFIERVSNAVVDPFRQLQNRILRSAGVGILPIDFSPIFAILVIQFLISLLHRLR